MFKCFKNSAYHAHYSWLTECIFGMPQILGMLPTQGENDNSDQYISPRVTLLR